MPEPLTDAQKVVRNDTGKRMAAALEALASEVDPSTVIAPEYDATQTYAVGDLVMYRSVLYRCTTAIMTPEEWTAAHWTAVTVADELANKYVKPTGGIPKNDLAAGVQESLDKADTALQEHQSLAAYRTAAAQDAIDANLMALGLTGASVGDLVRVAAVDANGKPTSWRKAPLCEIKTNPNLLDNWYFVGGGSQQGGGQFPINQRGQSQYYNSGYTIDRWAVSNVNVLNIDAQNIYSSAATNNAQVYQVIDSSKLVDGQTYTISVLLHQSCNGTYRMFLGGISSPYPAFGTTDFSNNGLYSATFTFNRNGYTGDWKFVLTTTSANTSQIWIKAVKLELGSEQTLVHQENGAWVLNEIPDYGQELAKCQRYYVKPIIDSPNIRKIDNIVYFVTPDTRLSNDFVIPSGYRPVGSDLRCMAWVVHNNAWVAGSLLIKRDGTVTVEYVPGGTASTRQIAANASWPVYDDI